MTFTVPPLLIQNAATRGASKGITAERAVGNIHRAIALIPNAAPPSLRAEPLLIVMPDNVTVPLWRHIEDAK